MLRRKVVAAADMAGLPGCKAALGGVLGRARMAEHASAPCVLAQLAFRAASLGPIHGGDH
jgi:hypothetical protein